MTINDSSTLKGIQNIYNESQVLEIFLDGTIHFRLDAINASLGRELWNGMI